jgi:hypothetical protein
MLFKFLTKAIRQSIQAWQRTPLCSGNVRADVSLWTDVNKASRGFHACMLWIDYSIKCQLSQNTHARTPCSLESIGCLFSGVDSIRIHQSIRYIPNRKCALVAMVIVAFWDGKFQFQMDRFGTCYPRMQQSP